MKRYTEFRGCLTTIEYDAAAGGFVQVAAPHPFTATQAASPEQAPEAQDPAAAIAVDERPAAGEMPRGVNGHATTNGTPTGDSIRQLHADRATARRPPGSAATLGARKTIPELQRPEASETI
jgi:hypothetical protein